MISLKTNAALVFVAGLTALGGCGMLKKKQPDPVASATVPAAPIPAAPAAAAPATATPEPEATVADEAIAAPEDFEDEAFQKVSDKTYKAELDGLKKDIEAK